MTIQNLIKYLVLIFFLVLIEAISRYFSPYKNTDFIVFLNVGHGDSILVASKNRYLLIDGGPSSSSTNSVYQYTLNKKPQKYLLTHCHSDHYSGFYKLVDSNTNYDLFYYDYTFQMHNKEVKTVKINLGDQVQIGNFTLEALFAPTDCDQENINLCSIILLLTHKNGKNVILFSDAEIESQSNILSVVPKNIYAVKVPHQGAKDAFNKELIDKMSPEIAVFSVGENNYGHPSSIVVDYYQQLGSKIYRTDEVGDVTLFFE